MHELYIEEEAMPSLMKLNLNLENQEGNVSVVAKVYASYRDSGKPTLEDYSDNGGWRILEEEEGEIRDFQKPFTRVFLEWLLWISGSNGLLVRTAAFSEGDHWGDT
ncbi:unnamed protein product [Arabis nemorensis]|uniref:Uncharacterized protein n=1 Tax=Arabis nemorensis TaxID=586526 RepID=A0A565BT87_9BRAS|nr:unnamed protein product [Arabis nemorensis]